MEKRNQELYVYIVIEVLTQVITLVSMEINVK